MEKRAINRLVNEASSSIGDVEAGGTVVEGTRWLPDDRNGPEQTARWQSAGYSPLTGG